MITIDASFWESVGVVNSDGNANGNQKDFYDSILMSNGNTVYNQYEFFRNSPVNSVYYDDQFDWYRAIGTFHSEPIYDQYSFYQNVTFDGVNKVGNQKDFFEFILGIRYFTTLQSASSQYYTIPTVTLTGDFEIEFDYSTTNTAAQMLIGASTAGNYIYKYTNTDLQLVAGGGAVAWNGLGAFDDGKLNTIKITRVSGVLNLWINDVDKGNASGTNSNSFLVSAIGARTNATLLPVDGVQSEVKIYDNSVSTDLIRYYKIDEDLSGTSTIIDSGSDGSNGTAISISSSELFTLSGSDWIGAELVTNGSFSTDTDWTKGAGWTISGGLGVATAAAAFSNIYQPSLTVVGLVYRVDFDVLNFSLGSVRWLAVTNALRVANGSYSLISEANQTSLFLGTASASNTLDIDNVSCKRILQAP